MGLRDRFRRKKTPEATTPEEKLFQAVYKLDLGKVQELLVAGANPNVQNNLTQTPLDVCAEKLESLQGYTAFRASEARSLLSTASSISRVWNELVRVNGTLNTHKDDHYANGVVMDGTDGNSTFTFRKPPRS